MEVAISKMMGRPKPRAEPGGEADEREPAVRLRFLRTARQARLHSLLEQQEHLLSKRALLGRRQPLPLPRSALLVQVLVLLLLLRPLRPAAAGSAVEKQLPVTNERCAVPRFVVSRGGGVRGRRSRGHALIQK